MSRFQSFAIVLSLTLLTACGDCHAATDDDSELELLRKQLETIRSAYKQEKQFSVIDAANELEKKAEKLLRGKPGMLAEYLEAVANVQLLTFRWDKGDILLKRVLKLRQEAWNADKSPDMAILVAFTFQQLGHNAMLCEDHGAASRYYEDGLSKLPVKVDEGGLTRSRDMTKAALLAASAENMTTTGDYEIAIFRFSQALAIARTLEPAAPEFVATINRQLGNALIEEGTQILALGDATQASKDFVEARVRLTEAGKYYSSRNNNSLREGLALVSILRGRNRCLLAENKNAEVEKSLELILEKMKEHLDGNLMGAFLRSDLAAAKLALGKRNEAIHQLRAALSDIERRHSPNLSEKGRITTELAKILLFAAEPQSRKEAVTLARQALQDQRSLLEKGFSYQTDRQRLLHAMRLRDTLNVILTSAFTPAAGPTQDTVRWVYTEVLECKSIAFTRSAFERAAVGLSKTALYELRKKYNDAASTHRQYSAIQRPADLSPDEWAKEEIQWRLRRDELERTLFAKVTPPGTANPITPITPGEISEALPATTALVDYVVYDHFSLSPDGKAIDRQPRIIAFISQSNQPPVCLQLGRFSDVARHIKEWHALLLDKKDAPNFDALPTLNKHAAELGRIVWTPISDHLSKAGVKQVIVCPDQLLWKVPFVALPGRNLNKLVIEEDINLSFILSGRQAVEMLRHRANYAKAPSDKCLVIGAIDYGSAKKLDNRLQNIAVAPKWVDDLVAHYKEAFPMKANPEELRAQDATATNVLAKCALDDGFGEIHLLAHGPIAPTPKVADWILGACRIRMPLAMSNLDSDKTGWRNCPDAEEISMLNLHRVGSFWWWGCTVNEGPALSGEGVIGIPRALHLAGCQAVLASSWQTRADYAMAFSAKVNTKVWKGATPAQALWEAQRAYVRGDRGVGRHPAYWAAWMMIGDVPTMTK